MVPDKPDKRRRIYDVAIRPESKGANLPINKKIDVQYKMKTKIIVCSCCFVVVVFYMNLDLYNMLNSTMFHV